MGSRSAVALPVHMDRGSRVLSQPQPAPPLGGKHTRRSADGRPKGQEREDGQPWPQRLEGGVGLSQLSPLARCAFRPEAPTLSLHCLVCKTRWPATFQLGVAVGTSTAGAVWLACRDCEPRVLSLALRLPCVLARQGQLGHLSLGVE